MRAEWKRMLLIALLTAAVLQDSCLSAGPPSSSWCEELRSEFRYPCVCEELGQAGGVALNCDGVVYPGDHVNLPKNVPVLAFTQRDAGHHSVPTQLFPSTGENVLLSS